MICLTNLQHREAGWEAAANVTSERKKGWESGGTAQSCGERQRGSTKAEDSFSALQSVRCFAGSVTHTKTPQSLSPKSKYVVFNQAKVIHKRADIYNLQRVYARKDCQKSE
ncbi:hypothetical protein ATANTOWER_009455 [Ataeniobius toweri]|uniref:Uncharacterized protein n=1 Tax=Ataeniobius toweri TaxID=208326 RepID=A0ABU7CBB4_9TELE|nr:hypothetical protein [Ataeniobius toweri]